MRHITLFLLFIAPFISASTAEIKNHILRVAVLDTGLDLKDPRFSRVLCKTGHYDATGTGIDDRHGHGTHVAGLIKQHAGPPGAYCLIIVKYTDKDEENNVKNYLRAMRYIDRIRPDIVNLSGGGNNLISEEFEIIGNNQKTIFIVGAGNEGKDIKDYYFPATFLYVYPNVMAVGAKDRKDSNFGKGVVMEEGNLVYSTLPGGKYGKMSGSSMATAVTTGKAIYAKTH